MKIEIEVPDGVIFCGIFSRGDGWGALVRCEPGFWPTKHGTFHTCSTASYGCSSKELAISVAVEKLKLVMAQLDGYARAPVRPEPKHNPAVLTGINLGELDL